MRVADIMLRDVVCAAPATPVEELVRLMVRHRVTGMPVVEDGIVVGVVSDGDLLRRATAAAAEAPEAGGWLGFLVPRAERAEAFLRQHGRIARDLMSAPVVEVDPQTPVAEAALLMQARGLKRLPVTDRAGRLLGLVTRMTLLQALDSQVPAPAAAPDDETLRMAVEEALERRDWGGGRQHCGVVVRGGVVHLWGKVRDAALGRAIEAVAAAIPGVKAVANHLDPFG